MSASASLSVADLVDQVEGLAETDPVAELPLLCAALRRWSTRGASRGTRYRLAVVLALTVGAVAAGCPFVCRDRRMRRRPAGHSGGSDRCGRCPSESVPRRVVQAVAA